MRDFNLEMLSLAKVEPSTSTEEIVLSFFIAFAMFENELIRSGFFVIRKSDFAEVNWDQFCVVVQARFPTIAHQVVEINRDFLQEEPPGRFFYDRTKNSFGWKLSKSDEASWQARRQALSASDFKELTVLLRRIRNNLFHGHKAMDSEHQIRERMSEGLKIVRSLEAALQQNQISNF